jgi:hypothetical protein
MSRPNTHQRQKRKNWFLLAVLLLAVGVFYYVTILKIAGN